MIAGSFGELLLLKAPDLPNPNGKPADKHEAAERSTARRPRLPNAQKSCYMSLKIRSRQGVQPVCLQTDPPYRTSLKARVAR